MDAKIGIPVLLSVTCVLLGAGWLVPIATFDTATGSDSHSIVMGIVELFRSGHHVLGAVIVAFSIVFPAVKVVALIRVWGAAVEDEAEKITWLGLLGKWSMLDVYVVAVFIGAIELGILAEVRSGPGVWVFGAAVLSSMVSTRWIEHAKGVETRIDRSGIEGIRSLPARLLSVSTAVLFVAGLALPLMEVEKWTFWSNDYSVLGSIGSMWAGGELAPAATLAIFVVLAPALHFGGMLAARFLERPPVRGLRWLVLLEEWAMLDVFALAVVVALVQAAGLAAITPRAGLACLLGAAALSGIDYWLFRRALRRSVKR